MLLPGSQRFAGQSFRPQALAVFVESLPPSCSFTHGFFGIRAPFGVSGQPLLAIENPWRANCKILAHGSITFERAKSCSKTVPLGRQCPSRCRNGIFAAQTPSKRIAESTGSAVG